VTELLKYWPILVIFIQGLALWAMWSMRQMSTEAINKADQHSRDRDQLLDNRIDHEATRITELSGRVDATQATIEDLPTMADLARVEGEVKVVGAKIDTANGGIQRLEGYFLSKGAGVAG